LEKRRRLDAGVVQATVVREDEIPPWDGTTWVSSMVAALVLKPWTDHIQLYASRDIRWCF
jgi:hypothetical protein